jgi:hypothetical protein
MRETLNSYAILLERITLKIGIEVKVKEKEKTYPSLTKQYAMKAYGGVDV